MEWTPDEKRLFDEYARLCELTLDSMIQQDRHNFTVEHIKTKTLTVTFRSRALGEEKVLDLVTDDHALLKEKGLAEAWSKEVKTLGELSIAAQGDLLVLVKKRAQQRGFKVSLRNDFDQDLVDLINKEKEACSKTDPNSEKFCLAAVHWINDLNVKGAEIGREARAAAIQRMVKRENERVARENQRKVALATTDSDSMRVPPSANPTTAIAQQQVAGASSPPQQRQRPPPIGVSEQSQRVFAPTPGSPRAEARSLAIQLAKLREQEAEIEQRLSMLNKRPNETLPETGQH